MSGDLKEWQALKEWREGRMVMEEILVRTGHQTFADLYHGYEETLQEIADGQSVYDVEPRSDEEYECRDIVIQCYRDFLHEDPGQGERLERMTAALLRQRRQQGAAVARSLGFGKSRRTNVVNFPGGSPLV